MKPKEGETYESWIERAKMYEHGRALQRLAQGDSVDDVMEDMSRRLVEKMLHPIFKEIRRNTETGFDVEESRKRYEEQYLKLNRPAADHVSND